MRSRIWSKLCGPNGRRTLQIFMGDLFATAVLVLLCQCVATQQVLRKGHYGGYVATVMGVMLAVAFAVQLGLKSSGAHLNPIVTMAMAITGRVSVWTVPVYWAAQYIGAFIGAVCAYGVYADAFNVFDGGNRTMFGETGTAVIFCSFPTHERISTLSCLIDQVVAASLIVLGLLAMVDVNNLNMPLHLLPVLSGLLVGTVILAMSFNCMAPLNPAKDLSSRIFLLMAGWGDEAFTYRDYNWFWVPIVGPHLGALVGIGLYKVFYGDFLRHEARRNELDNPIVISKLIDDEHIVKMKDMESYQFGLREQNIQRF